MSSLAILEKPKELHSPLWVKALAKLYGNANPLWVLRAGELSVNIYFLWF